MISAAIPVEMENAGFSGVNELPLCICACPWTLFGWWKRQKKGNTKCQINYGQIGCDVDNNKNFDNNNAL